jgi:DNA-binding NtrC family response regulator
VYSSGKKGKERMSRALKLLVVDDEEIVRYPLLAILKRLGHHAEGEQDGLAGLHSIEKGDYDAVFVDVRMPGLNGIDLLCRAKELRPEIRIVMMSGGGFDDTRKEAMQKGAFAFVQKPLRIADLQELTKKISSSLST